MSNCIRGSRLLLDLNSCLLALSPLVKWTFIVRRSGLFLMSLPYGTGSVSRYLKPHILFISFHSNLVDLWYKMPITCQKTHSPHAPSILCLFIEQSFLPGQWLALHGESQLLSLFLWWALHRHRSPALFPFLSTLNPSHRPFHCLLPETVF